MGITFFLLFGNKYVTSIFLICPDCFNEWNPTDKIETIDSDVIIVKDANGIQLENGDTVVTIKNLPVKGTSQTIKAGTKVKKIKLTLHISASNWYHFSYKINKYLTRKKERI